MIEIHMKRMHNINKKIQLAVMDMPKHLLIADMTKGLKSK